MSVILQLYLRLENKLSQYVSHSVTLTEVRNKLLQYVVDLKGTVCPSKFQVFL
jgi:hypothetical protein